MLRIGGVTPLSASDYPDKLAAVLYCQGCAWRCSYCHNTHLLEKRSGREIPWADILVFLRRRQGLLDAVVFSGGEPTLQPSLGQAVREAKALGYLVGLHTAGIVPARLKQVLPLVDWVSMDLKAPFHEHERVTQVAGSGTRAQRSMELLLASGVACEFHTIDAVPGELRAQSHHFADN
ncbi:MAG TPA: anaerobic ribonucleoside-triphosphate reductase activating protein [Burkholderiales bacterium]|jgi:pyruvate formate lyase activating enzyme|nr:anaerobic ribonucleoside-triphosphate reductase activating protein [Burkholderiales bacterium]